MILNLQNFPITVLLSKNNELGAEVRIHYPVNTSTAEQALKLELASGIISTTTTVPQEGKRAKSSGSKALRNNADLVDGG